MIRIHTRHSSVRRHRLALAAYSAVVTLLSTAYSQTTSEGMLEEVIVTAQKRPQSVQDVPIAISALSGQDLARLGVTNSRELAAAVPNLTWVATEGTNVSNVYIRGVGDFSFQVNQVGAVGLYRDEVSLNSPILSSFGLFDLERVEVLRGPQNTLFGRNTTGGAIQFISQKPRLDESLGGYASATGGNYGRVDVEGALNLAIGERVAVRLAGARFARGNYIDNLNLHVQEGAFQRSAGRAELLWKVTDDLDALFTAEMGTFRGSTARYKQIGLGTPTAPGFTDCPYLKYNGNPGNGCSDQTGFVDSNRYADVWANNPNLFKTNASGGNVRLDWRLPAVKLTSLTAFQHADSKRVEDTDAGPSFIFNLDQTTNTDQWSQELRLTSLDSAPVRWIAGAYYFQEEANWGTVVRRANPFLTNVLVPGTAIPEAGVQSLMPFVLAHQKDPVWSGYGQAEFKIAEKTNFTLGLRYTHERKEGLVQPGSVADAAPLFPASQFIGANEINQLLIGATQVGPGSLRLQCPKPFPLTHCYSLLPFALTDQAVGGKAALDYHFADHLLGYVSIARGFKAGGISLGPLDYVLKGGSNVRPEFLTTYELGLKAEGFDNTVRLNSAVFYNRWSDQQLFLPVNAPPFGPNPIYTNVPKTQSYGLETELEWVPTPLWYLMTSLGVLRSEVKDPGAELLAANGAQKGSVLIASPKLTWNGLLRKEWPVADGHLGVQGDWHYTGSQHYDLINSPDQIEPSYWIYNANIAYRFGANERYSISVWGKNLTRTQYCVNRGSLAGLGFGDTSVCVPNEATRFFGLTLRAKFE